MARAPKASAPKAAITSDEDQASQTTAVTNWDEELANMAKLAAGMEVNTGGGQYFSLRGGILSFNDQAMPGNEMAVVILDSIMENTFYEGKFDPNELVPPVCFAFGRDDTTMAPHPSVVAVEQDQHETCQGCPMNAFGTAEVGKGKACANKRRLAMIPAGEFSKSGDFTAFEDAGQFAKAPIAFLKVPTMSVRGLAAYVKALQGTLNRPPLAVFTKVKVIPDAKSQFRVTFEALEPVPNALLATLMKRHKEAAATIESPYDLTPRDATPAEKPAAKGRTAPAAKPAAKNVRPEVKKPTKRF